MCNWVTMLYSRKLTEICKPAIMEKKNHYTKNKIKGKKHKEVRNETAGKWQQSNSWRSYRAENWPSHQSQSKYSLIFSYHVE